MRIGVQMGDVVVERERIYGDGVNIAARLEELAEWIASEVQTPRSRPSTAPEGQC